MKKIVLIFAIMIITAISCIAAERDRWLSLPINVYIPEYGKMSVLMKQAFNAWQVKSNSLVRFKYVGSPLHANIIVEFVDFVSGCNDVNAVGCTTMTTRGGVYDKAYVTIGTKEYVSERNGSHYSRKIVTRSKEHIYGVMLHEAGHAIGLGHSSSNNSIMYPYDLDSMQYLTNEDMKLLYNKYH